MLAGERINKDKAAACMSDTTSKKTNNKDKQGTLVRKKVVVESNVIKYHDLLSSF